MIKVLIVDDSAVVRRVLSEELSKAADIQVVGTAIDPFVAREKIIALEPDVLTLDLEMPRMGGLAFLRKLMKYRPLPVVVVSSLTPEGSEAAIRALELGAVDVVAKPGPGYSVAEIGRMVVDRIRAAARVRRISGMQGGPPAPVPIRPAVAGCGAASRKVIAIAASTGGTEAIKMLLMGLPENTPGTVIVQHMPAQFTSTFAARMNELCLMKVREAESNDPVKPGVALIAPGNQHMVVCRRQGQLVVEIRNGPFVHHQRPSADVLFHSVARRVGPDAVGVILTGMGADGARGLLAMRAAGARTLAQDEETCAVFGMPREALRIGAAERAVPITAMARCILEALAGAPARQPELAALQGSA